MFCRAGYHFKKHGQMHKLVNNIQNLCNIELFRKHKTPHFFVTLSLYIAILFLYE